MIEPTERGRRTVMLHMIVSTHNPESCGFRGEQEDEILRDAIEGFSGAASG
jgi:hypothetical protein